MKNQARPVGTGQTAQPVWPAAVSLLSVGGLHLALPSSLTIGPSWLLLAIIAVLIVPVLAAQIRGSFALNRRLGFLLLGVVTAFMVWALAALVRALIFHQIAPNILLQAATALWVTNILVFASWYWRLDAGGPHARHLRGNHTEGDFLFPQMTLPPRKDNSGVREWSPGFIDYLFLAFNSSTAFSPTDSPVLSRWAKVAMMVQASISFATVALLAARAVNIL